MVVSLPSFLRYTSSMNADDSDDDADTRPSTACSDPVNDPKYVEPLTVSAVDDAYGKVDAVVEVATKYDTSINSPPAVVK